MDSRVKGTMAWPAVVDISAVVKEDVQNGYYLGERSLTGIT